MYSKVFADAGHLLVLPIVALFLFIAIFVGVVVRAVKRKPQELDRLALLPFGEEEGHE